MKTLIAAAAAFAALGLGGAAMAHPGHNEDKAPYAHDGGRHDPYLGPRAGAYNGRGAGINERQERLADRIAIGFRTGDLTRREVRYLRGELAYIERLEQRYRYDGLSRWERDDLQARLDVLSDKVRFQRNDRQDRYAYHY